MRLPLDVATRVSPELSDFIDDLVNARERQDSGEAGEAPTLDDVRNALTRESSAALRRDRALHPQHEASMLDELDVLIADFGPDALASEFIVSKAGEALSRVIECAMGNPVVRHEPTLGGVRQAMLSGLTAELVGDGVIDGDEDQSLQLEIEALIARHGEDAIAEDFIRFE